MHIKIGTPADYAPFSFKDSITNKYVGFDIELIESLIVNLNFTLEFIKTNWYDLDHDLTSNKFDMAIGGISLTDNRIEKFLTSIPIMDDAKTILTSVKHIWPIRTLSDIDKLEYTIITNRGGTNERFVNEHIKYAKIIVLDDNMSIFEKIAVGTVDFMITDLSEALYRESIDPRLIIAKPITLYTKKTSYGFLYNKNKEELKTIFDTALAKFLQSEKFKQIHNKYFSLKKQSNAVF